MQTQQEDGKSQSEPFINVSEMELNIATKGRAASYDYRQIGRAPANKGQANLPQIGAQGGGSGLPGLSQVVAGAGAQIPTKVLPHSEPLNEALKKQAEPFLELFGQEIMTCFLS